MSRYYAGGYAERRLRRRLAEALRDARGLAEHLSRATLRAQRAEGELRGLRLQAEIAAAATTRRRARIAELERRVEELLQQTSPRRLAEPSRN